MTFHRDGDERVSEQGASDRDKGQASSGGEVSPYERGLPLPEGVPRQSSPVPPLRRSPIELELRPLPPRSGRFGTAWSHPMVVTMVLLLILLLVVTLAWALLREPLAIVGASGDESSPTPSASASAVVATTPSADGPEPSTAAPSEDSGGQATAPGSSGLPDFGASAAIALAGGAVRLEIDSYGLLINASGEWRPSDGWGGLDNGEGSDINFTASGVTARRGVQLALLEDVPLPNFDTCKSQDRWTSSLTWSQASRGTFVCLRTRDGRRGLMRINNPPKPDVDGLGGTDFVEVEGVLWAPIVDE